MSMSAVRLSAGMGVPPPLLDPPKTLRLPKAISFHQGRNHDGGKERNLVHG